MPMTMELAYAKYDLRVAEATRDLFLYLAIVCAVFFVFIITIPLSAWLVYLWDEKRAECATLRIARNQAYARAFALPDRNPSDA